MNHKTDSLIKVKLLLTRITQAIVEEPTKVSVEAETSDNTTVMLLRVAPSDLHAVAGEAVGGSLRCLLGSIGAQYKHSFTLNVGATERN